MPLSRTSSTTLNLTAIPPIKAVCLNLLLIRRDVSVGWINASAQSPTFNTKLFRILQLLIGIGLILGIIGVTSAGSQTADGTFTPSTISKAGVVLYIGNFAAITIISILLLRNVSALPDPERPLLVYIPVALLAIAVRLLYSALCIFVHNSTFSLFGGNIVADVLMAIVEEFFVVVITLVLGFKLGRTNPPMEGEIINLNRKSGNHGRELHESQDGIYAPLSNPGFETFSST